MTVHGGWQKQTGGELDFSGLASYYIEDPTPPVKIEPHYDLQFRTVLSEKLADEQPPEENLQKLYSHPNPTIIKKEPK